VANHGLVMRAIKISAAQHIMTLAETPIESCVKTVRGNTGRRWIIVIMPLNKSAEVKKAGKIKFTKPFLFFFLKAHIINKLLIRGKTKLCFPLLILYLWCIVKSQAVVFSRTGRTRRRKGTGKSPPPSMGTLTRQTTVLTFKYIWWIKFLFSFWLKLWFISL